MTTKMPPRIFNLFTFISLLLIILISCDEVGPLPRFTSAPLYPISNVKDPTLRDTGTLGESVPESTESTNQPREVVEPDVIRQYGGLLFCLNQYRGLIIVDLDQKRVVSVVPVYGYPRDLYVVGNRAYVLLGYATRHTIQDGVVKRWTGAVLYAVDISNVSNPTITAELTMEGDFVDSRLVGDVLYAVTSDYAYETTAYSTDSIGAETTSWTKVSGNRCWINSIYLRSEPSLKITDRLEFPGYGTVVQASNRAIYVCAPSWDKDLTQVTYVDITDPAGRLPSNPVSVWVPGMITDRFKLDEWNGYLRVVSNTSWRNRQTYLTVFQIVDSASLQQVSQIFLPQASGETLYATRFAGPLAYLVTYLTIDPLFVVDLSDPLSPKVAGELKVPGWSVHLEPLSNKQLLGLGVDDTDNRRRVKVSWFDVRDPATPVEVDSVSLGEGWGWSSAFYDDKAFRVFDEQWIVVPFSGDLNGQYQEWLVFVYRDVVAGKLRVLGAVEVKGGQVSRTVAYADYFYAMTMEYLHEISISNGVPQLTGTAIPLAENVVDVLPITENGKATGWIEVIQSWETQNITLQWVDSTMTQVIHTLSVDKMIQYVDAVEVSSNEWLLLGLAGSKEKPWDETAGCRLIHIALDRNISRLQIKDNILIDWVPYERYGWYWGYRDVVMEGGVGGAETPLAMAKRVVAYPYPGWGGIPDWFGSRSNGFRCGDRWVIRGWAKQYDTVLGKKIEPYEGMLIISINNPREFKRVGLGYENIVSVGASDRSIFITTQHEVNNTTRANLPLISYYLCEIDPATLVESGFRIVPGVFWKADTQASIVYLRDYQYAQVNETPGERVYGGIGYYPYWFGPYEQWVRSIRWKPVKPIKVIDSVRLPENLYSEPFLELPYLCQLFWEPNKESIVLQRITVSADGKFSSPAQTALGQLGWTQFITQRQNQLVLNLDSASLLFLTLSTSEPPRILRVAPIPSAPLKTRVVDNQIILIYGKAGWNIAEIQ